MMEPLKVIVDVETDVAGEVVTDGVVVPEEKPLSWNTGSFGLIRFICDMSGSGWKPRARAGEPL